MVRIGIDRVDVRELVDFDVLASTDDGTFEEVRGDAVDHFAAGCVIVAIPIVTLFMFLQKYYVEGVTAGAVKG